MLQSQRKCDQNRIKANVVCLISGVLGQKVGCGGANPFLLGGADGISRRGDVAAEFDLNKSKCIALAGDKVDFSGGGAAAGDVIVCQNLPPVEAKIPTCRQLG